MTLRERRCAFTAATIRLLSAVLSRGWSFGKVEVAFDEGTIHTPRRVRNMDGSVATMDDAVHKRGGRHYDGLAVDLLLYIDGVYISDGSHPIWTEIDRMAAAIDRRLSLGIDFGDANHLSWEEGRPAELPPGVTSGGGSL